MSLLDAFAIIGSAGTVTVIIVGALVKISGGKQKVAFEEFKKRVDSDTGEVRRQIKGLDERMERMNKSIVKTDLILAGVTATLKSVDESLKRINRLIDDGILKVQEQK